MICKHCHLEIYHKNGVWYEVLSEKQKTKLRYWKIGDYSMFTSVCVRSISNTPEFGDHEPTKESIVGRILDKIDGA